jgi:hypothetical protein
MKHQTEKRIQALEAALGKNAKIKIVWDDGCSDQGEDIEAICRARAAAGENVVAVSWLGDEDAPSGRDA